MGRTFRKAVLALVAACTAAGALAADPPDLLSARPTKEEQLAALVETVNSAFDCRVATKAYARGMAIDDTHSPLAAAYLRKALLLGRLALMWLAEANPALPGAGRSSRQLRKTLADGPHYLEAKQIVEAPFALRRANAEAAREALASAGGELERLRREIARVADVVAADELSLAAELRHVEELEAQRRMLIATYPRAIRRTVTDENGTREVVIEPSRRARGLRKRRREHESCWNKQASQHV